MSQMQPKRAEPVITTEVVFPQDTNHYGKLFGGKLMSWMDKISYYAAVRHCGFPSVTASIESIDFAVSPGQGDLIELQAQVIFTGTSSMVIKVDAYRMEVAQVGVKTLANTGYFNFVALDKEGRPKPIPPLLVQTPEEEELFELGKNIRQAALNRRRRAN